jgi:hypothetical protein
VQYWLFAWILPDGPRLRVIHLECRAIPDTADNDERFATECTMSLRGQVAVHKLIPDPMEVLMSRTALDGATGAIICTW